MTKQRKEQNRRENGLLALWSISQYNNAIEKYREINRKYCLCKAKWEEVVAAQQNARYCGVSDETLVSIDIEVMNSITDKELHEAVYGE